MSRLKKPLARDLERALIRDADNPDAWEDPITVNASGAPRPSWYGNHPRSSPTAAEPEQPLLIHEAAMSFANLEHSLEISLWRLVIAGDENQQPLIQAVTAEMSFDRKVNAFANLFKLRFPDEVDDPELQAILNELFIAHDERNAILHSGSLHSKDAGLTEDVQIEQILDHIAAIVRRFDSFSATRVAQRIAMQPSA